MLNYSRGFQTVEFLFVWLTEMSHSAYNALGYKQWGLLLLKKKDFEISFEVKWLHWHQSADSTVPQKNLSSPIFIDLTPSIQNTRRHHRDSIIKSGLTLLQVAPGHIHKTPALSLETISFNSCKTQAWHYTGNIMSPSAILHCTVPLTSP